MSFNARMAERERLLAMPNDLVLGPITSVAATDVASPSTLPPNSKTHRGTCDLSEQSGVQYDIGVAHAVEDIERLGDAGGVETFLHQVLDYPWDEVHQEAERLEHFISERFEERIAAKLGHPEFDPHGHAIPAMDGSLPSKDNKEPQSLSQLRPGQSAKVSSVSDKDPEMLRYLASQGIRPGVRLTLSEQLPFKGAFQVRIGTSAKPALLSHTLAEAISVAVK